MTIPNEILVEIIKDFKNGMSCRKLEQEYGYNRKQISKQLKEMGETVQHKYPSSLLQEAKQLIKQRKSVRQVAKLLNIDKDQLSRNLSRLNIRPVAEPKNQKQKFIESEETLFIVEKYQQGQSIKQIADNILRSTNYVYRILNHYGVVETNRLSKTYHLQNERLFQHIDTEEKAYWLGFLMAEASISSAPNTYTLEFMLAEKDRERVEAFVKFVDSDPSIPVRRKVVNGYPQVRATVYSISMIQDLAQWGCIPRKSLIKKFPSPLPNDMIRHFIRGYFDGNGCVCFNQRQLHFSIVSSQYMCEAIEQILLTEQIVKSHCKFGRSGQAWILRHGGNLQARKFFDYLYKDSTTYLKRKYDVFNAVLSQRQ